MADFAEIFQPFIDLFSQGQVQTILLAWLPTKLGPYMTGIMAVDMFLTSVIASGLTTLALALYRLLSTFSIGNSWRKNVVTVQVEYYAVGTYGDLYTSTFYEALSWIISQQTKKLNKGSFVVQPTNSTVNDDEDECAPPDFNILPEKEQKITIEYKGKTFDVTFNMPAQESNDNGNNNNNNSGSNTTKQKPSIYLTTIEDSASVDSISEFLNEVTRAYLETQKRMKVRSRYERNDSYWYHVQTLSSVRGLDSVALDEPQEILLKKELETFVNDKDFYERIGMPYRRGILLYGKPGTGKTSLINAISAHLSRDIYYLNLKNISDDNELSAAFSAVPANQIIVLEDVDTQSRVLHKRKTRENSISTSEEPSNNNKNEGAKVEFSKFSLSTFLGCLDGHILSEGNIIIMTTNHVEHLDPACIRPGRMDMHLDLRYCTHYQIKKMYKSVVEDPEAEFPQDILEKIPERLLPPCEVMMTMVLYRNEVDIIPQKVYEIVAKYKDMKPEDIARQLEEEAHRIREASRKLEEKEEENGEVKDGSGEVKDENEKGNKEEMKKEEIKSETMINNSNEITKNNNSINDSDSDTDVEINEVNDGKIKFPTSTITSQVAVTS